MTNEFNDYGELWDHYMEMFDNNCGNESDLLEVLQFAMESAYNQGKIDAGKTTD